jgi:hypothetical protein
VKSEDVSGKGRGTQKDLVLVGNVATLSSRRPETLFPPFLRIFAYIKSSDV